MKSLHIKNFTPYVGMIVLALSFTAFLAIIPKDTAQAWSPSDCGVVNNGNEHSYAGMVVRLYVSVNGAPRQPLSGWQVSDMNVKVSTVGRTASPPGNVLRIDSSGQEVPGSRTDFKADFHPNTGGDCDGMVVITGTPGHWAIDCDVSKNGDAQQIKVSSADQNYIPNGYKDLNTYRQGSWDFDQDTLRPPNGGSVVYEMTYRTSTEVNAQAKAKWTLNNQTSVVDNKTLVRRGESVNFYHQFNLSPTWQPAPTPVRSEPTCTSSSTTCRNRWAVYNQYVEDKKAADTVNYINEMTARNNNSNHPLVIKKNWVLWDRNKALKLFGYWGGTNIVSQGVGSDRAVPYQASATSSDFNSATVQNILAAGDTYCEYTYTTAKDYQVSYNNGNTSDNDSGGFWYPGACVTVRSEWSTTNGGNQNIERTDNNGVASRGIGEVVPPNTTRNGDYTFSDVWVNEKYRINGWVVNSGPEYSDEPIAVRTQVTDNIIGSFLDPADTFTTGYNIPPGSEMSPRLGYDILSGNQPIPTDAAGKGVCQRTFWNSAFGDPNPNFNGNTPLACIYVPYFYHIKSPTLNRQGGTGPVQQGDSIQLQATATLPQVSDGSGPGTDNNGRHHTNSEDIGWAIERSDDGGAWNVISGHSGHRVWQPDNTTVNINDSSAPVISGSDTYNMPIGKKICFRLRIDKGSQDTGPIYSNPPSCYTITKSPKIQVGNRDVLTGYGIPTGPNDAECTSNNNASVIATGAPSYVSSYSNKNLYGSWGEYGVFATGSITNFGSAAYDSSDSGASKLRFSNQNEGNNGGYKYSNGCTFNWFEKTGKKTSEIAGSGVKEIMVNDSTNSGTEVNYKEGNVNVVAPGSILAQPEDTETRVATVSIYGMNQSQGYLNSNISESCATIKVTMENSQNVYTGSPSSPNKGVWCLGQAGVQQFDFTLEQGKYNPGKIKVEFMNDFNQARDDINPPLNNKNRNLGITWISINYNDTSSLFYARDLDKSRRLGNEDGKRCQDNSASLAGVINNLSLSLKQSQGASAVDKGKDFCYGLEALSVDFMAPTAVGAPGKITPRSVPTPAPQPLPDGGALPASSEPTIIYAKKKSTTDCSAANPDSGVINIKNNIIYGAGYDMKRIPRVILLADCGIVIDKDVTNVDASLITRGIINTCSARQASSIPLNVTGANYSLTKDDCNKPLKITGHILAKKVNLLRTYGADLSSSIAPGFSGDPTIPAEDFTQNPIDFISTYRQSYQEVKLVPEDETNLPPRY